MYRINTATNRITPVQQARFGDLQFSERYHLQEWLANQPDALGEELLILAKEFDGFDDTNERLDLLALDRTGALVVVENKLDDSGKDVVWQSLKYASYCSTLSSTSIAEIFQKHLDKSLAGQDAKALICEFLQEETFDEVVLNRGKDQRIIMVAAQFRKEVTSTVLWLLKYGLHVKCFKVTPFHDGADHFLTVEQVIPLREAEDLMIGIARKEEEEQETERGKAKRSQFRIEFWHQMLEAMRVAGVQRYLNVNPLDQSWLYASCGISGVHYGVIFTRSEARVEFGLGRPSKEQNKALFDQLMTQSDALTAAFGGPLIWRREDGKKTSIVETARSFDGHNREAWPEMIRWIVSSLQGLERAIDPQLPRLRATLATMQVDVEVAGADVGEPE